MPGLRIFARRDEDGTVWSLWLRAGAGGLELHDEADGSVRGLAASLVLGAFARYGKPVEPSALEDQPAETAVAVEAPGRRALLRGFRFLAFGDAHPNDWIALEEAGRPTLAVPAPLFGGSLSALARAAAGAA